MGKLMIDLITNSTFWEAVSAICTLLAVVVSLYLARPKKKPSLHCSIIETSSYADPRKKNLPGSKKIVVTIKNIGDVPVAIVEAGFKTSGKVIEHSINKYKKSIDFPIKIKSGEIELIEYFISEQDSDYKHLSKMLADHKFTLKDSSGNFYQSL